MTAKIFTLEEARARLPVVRELILAAKEDLENLADDLLDAREKCDRAERRMKIRGESLATDLVTGTAGFAEPARSSQQLEDYPSENSGHVYVQAAERYASMETNYVTRLKYWIDQITTDGVILRDLGTGLIDFPARKGDLDYLLCWRLDEPDIVFWHLRTEGFIGRKPLVVLIEY